MSPRLNRTSWQRHSVTATLIASSASCWAAPCGSSPPTDLTPVMRVLNQIAGQSWYQTLLGIVLLGVIINLISQGLISVSRSLWTKYSAPS